MAKKQPDLRHLCHQVGLSAMRRSINEIFQMIKSFPDRAFSEVTIGENKKKALSVDYVAELNFERQLCAYLEKRRLPMIKVYGEENLNDKESEKLNLLEKAESNMDVFALVDMVDGTDLLERDLSNWCSAAIFFQPKADPGKRILAAFVAMPSRSIYYSVAKDGKQEVYVKSRQKNPRQVAGVSSNTNLLDASVCFYGQKALNLHRIFHKDPEENTLLDYVMKSDSKDTTFRIYNLAGIPMMIKLLDHKHKKAKNIDVIFDIKGQKPHDVVPGAYLAMQAGATVRNLKTGKDMTLEDLEESLMKPAAKDSSLKYIIAATRELADEIQPLLIPLIKK